MTIPTVTPIVMPLPSLGHRKICVAGLARGHPDSGEAAIMGVPLPHLVLPSTMALALCVVCASPRDVGADRRRACPHRRDVGPLVHSRCQWWCDPLGNNGSCEVVCVNRGRSTHIGYPRWSGRVGRVRVRSFDIPWWVCVVAVMGLCDRRFGTPW